MIMAAMATIMITEMRITNIDKKYIFKSFKLSKKHKLQFKTSKSKHLINLTRSNTQFA